MEAPTITVTNSLFLRARKATGGQKYVHTRVEYDTWCANCVVSLAAREKIPAYRVTVENGLIVWRKSVKPGTPAYRRQVYNMTCEARKIVNAFDRLVTWDDFTQAIPDLINRPVFLIEPGFNLEAFFEFMAETVDFKSEGASTNE